MIFITAPAQIWLEGLDNFALSMKNKSMADCIYVQLRRISAQLNNV
jgi:hypothetical protein